MRGSASSRRSSRPSPGLVRPQPPRELPCLLNCEVDVDRVGDGKRGVPEAARDDPHRHAHVQQVCGEAVAQIVQARRPQLAALGPLPVLAGHAPRVVWPSVGPRTNQVVVLVGRPQLQTLRALTCLPALQALNSRAKRGIVRRERTVCGTTSKSPTDGLSERRPYHESR